MPLKIETVEDKQLPRWVYAMMSANQDPNADPELADNPALKRLAKEKAETFYKKRQSRLKELAEQSPPSSGGRLTGMEWKTRPKNKFTSAELDSIMPTRRMSYVASKAGFISVVMAGVLAFTSVTVFAGASVCAELKVNGNFHNAWETFTASPAAYYQRVIGILTAPDE